MPTAKEIKQTEEKLQRQLAALRELQGRGKLKTSEDVVQAMQSLTQIATAWLLGVSTRTLRDRAGCPQNENGTYNAQDVFAWHLKQAAAKGEADESNNGDTDEILQRKRLADTELRELDLARRRGEVVNVDEFMTWLTAEVTGPWRKALERLQRRYGQEAVDLMLTAINRGENALQERRQTE